MLLAFKGSTSSQTAPQRPQTASEKISAAPKNEHQTLNNSVSTKTSQHSTCCGHPIIPAVFHQPVSPAPFQKPCDGHSKLSRAPGKQESGGRRKAPYTSPSPEPPNNCCLSILAKHEPILLGGSCPKGGSCKGPGGPSIIWKALLESRKHTQSMHH